MLRCSPVLEVACEHRNTDRLIENQLPPGEAISLLLLNYPERERPPDLLFYSWNGSLGPQLHTDLLTRSFFPTINNFGGKLQFFIF